MIINKKDLTEVNLKQELTNICNRLGLNDIKEALFFPKFFQLETVRLCNAKCPYCACDQWDKKVPYISETLFDKVVTELSEYKDWVKWVCLSRAGEPLLDKNIAEHVSKLKKAGIKRVNLTTNAALLDEKKARSLITAGLDEIMFSIDSIEKSEYEKIKIGLKYDKVINNITTFFKIRNEMKPNMIVRVRAVSFFNLSEKEERQKLINWEKFWGQFRKNQDRIYMKKPHNWGNQKVWAGHTPDYDLVYHPCILPWSTLHISAMGKATLCPMDYDAKMDLGDFNKQTIKEIWNSNKLKNIRQLHSTGKRNEIRFCQGCKIFDPDMSLEHQDED